MGVVARKEALAEFRAPEYALVARARSALENRDLEAAQEASQRFQELTGNTLCCGDQKKELEEGVGNLQRSLAGEAALAQVAAECLTEARAALAALEFDRARAAYKSEADALRSLCGIREYVRASAEERVRAGAAAVEDAATAFATATLTAAKAVACVSGSDHWGLGTAVEICQQHLAKDAGCGVVAAEREALAIAQANSLAAAGEFDQAISVCQRERLYDMRRRFVQTQREQEQEKPAAEISTAAGGDDDDDGMAGSSLFAGSDY
jgi:hypothetical protein